MYRSVGGVCVGVCVGEWVGGMCVYSYVSGGVPGMCNCVFMFAYLGNQDSKPTLVSSGLVVVFLTHFNLFAMQHNMPG